MEVMFGEISTRPPTGSTCSLPELIFNVTYFDQVPQKVHFASKNWGPRGVSRVENKFLKISWPTFLGATASLPMKKGRKQGRSLWNKRAKRWVKTQGNPQMRVRVYAPNANCIFNTRVRVPNLWHLYLSTSCHLKPILACILVQTQHLNPRMLRIIDRIELSIQ